MAEPWGSFISLCEAKVALSREGVAMTLSKLRAWLELVRIGNALAIGLASIVGYVLSGGTSIRDGVMLFLSSLLIGAAGNVINDYFDREIDRVNKPWRPIPSGRISPSEALAGFIALSSAGLALSLFLPIECVAVAAIAIVLLFLYSASFKKKLLLGNNTIAALSALNIVYGGLASPNPCMAIVPAIYAYLLILGREFLKSLEDVRGDSIHGVKTLATVYGPRVAYIAAVAVLGLLIAISPLPFLLMHFNTLYLILAVLGTDLTIVIALIKARNLVPRSAWHATRLMKLSFVLGLLAFLFGAPTSIL